MPIHSLDLDKRDVWLCAPAWAYGRSKRSLDRAHDPIIAGFYQQRRRAGKPSKVALTACIGKLLVILNALLCRNMPWQPA